MALSVPAIMRTTAARLSALYLLLFAICAVLLVFYSLGTLLTYGPFSMHEPTNRGAVACATIDSAGYVSNAELRLTLTAADAAQPDELAAKLTAAYLS